MDYCSLLLISDIVEYQYKKILTKLDLQWSYDDVMVKKKDEWKMVFTTLEESFKPIVRFFSLINLLITFQMIMNKISYITK